MIEDISTVDSILFVRWDVKTGGQLGSLQ